MEISATDNHVLGDIHGEVGMLNEYINKKHPEVIILLGDVALFWNDSHYYDYDKVRGVLNTSAFDKLKPHDTKVFWLPGNHECWSHLDNTFGRYTEEPIELKTNVFYCPIGSQLTINNRNCLFVGGAYSIDKEARTSGVDWFLNEILTEFDYQYIIDRPSSYDILFSHTCPYEYNVIDKWDNAGRIEDQTRHILSKLRNYYKFKYNFFGHWHRQLGGTYKETIWQCVNTISPGYGSSGKYAIDISELFGEH